MNDAEWFEKNPHRLFRLRPYVPGEFGKPIPVGRLPDEAMFFIISARLYEEIARRLVITDRVIDDNDHDLGFVYIVAGNVVT